MTDFYSEHDEPAVSARDLEALLFAEREVSHWNQFPVGEPRPIVLLDGPIKVDQGFQTGGATHALMYGVVAADQSVLLEPPQIF